MEGKFVWPAPQTGKEIVVEGYLLGLDAEE